MTDQTSEIIKRIESIEQAMTVITLLIRSMSAKQDEDIILHAQMREFFGAYNKGETITQAATLKKKTTVKKVKAPPSLESFAINVNNPTGPKSVYLTLCKNEKDTFSEKVAVVSHKMENTPAATREYTDYMDLYAKYFSPYLEVSTVPKEYIALRNYFIKKWNDVREDSDSESESESDEEKPVVKAKAPAKSKK
jgi:hypothetical protein